MPLPAAGGALPSPRGPGDPVISRLSKTTSPRAKPSLSFDQRAIGLTAAAPDRSPVEVGAGRRQAGWSARALGREGLEHAQIGALEAERNAGKVGEPNSRLHAADLAFRGIAVCKQAIVPEASRACVVLAPAFDIVHFEAVALQIGNRHRDMVELPAGKDVTDHGQGLGRPFAEMPVVTFRPPRDRMVQVKPARLEQAIDGLKISRMVGKADVLEHPDGSNPVIFSAQCRIVGELDARQTDDLIGRGCELLLGQCDAVGADAMMSRRMTNQGAPAATDVEKRISRLEPKVAG